MPPKPVEYLLGCLKEAEEQGLQYEFIMSFLQDLNLADKKVIEACNCAMYEWDM